MVVRSRAVARPVHAVDQQDVQPAVAIVIEEGAARAHRLGQVLGAECAAVVAEVDAGRRGDIGQAEVQARRRRASSGAAAPRAAETCGASRDAHQPLADRVDHQFGGVVDAQRLHDIGAVHGHRIDAEARAPPRSLCSICRARSTAALRVRAWSTAGDGCSPGRSSDPSRGSSTCLPAATCFTASTSSRSIAFFSR